LAKYFFDDEEFKVKYISIIEKLRSELLEENEDEASLCFVHNIDELRDAKVISGYDDPELNNDDEVINKEESTHIRYLDFKGEYGYISNDDNGYIEISNADLLNFFELESNSKIIGNLELMHPTLYLQRVDIDGSDISIFDSFFLNYHLNEKNITVKLITEHSFLFSYKLHKKQHPEPLRLDFFIEIRGDDLDLEECRSISKSLMFELNCVSGAVLTPQPNEPDIFDYDVYDNKIEEKRKHLKEYGHTHRNLLICKDTENVIDIYNRANSCSDFEMSILYFSKAIEYVSETVVRSKVTEVGRKALTSNRAMKPDANFIKELQELFQNCSYKSDSESMKLTIQTCCYINDLLLIIPEYIKNKFNKHRKKSDDDALVFLALCISATRNNIAHAKANYRETGNEIPEDHYENFANLMRVMCQHCIRWYAAQSSSMRVVS